MAVDPAQGSAYQHLVSWAPPAGFVAISKPVFSYSPKDVTLIAHEFISRIFSSLCFEVSKNSLWIPNNLVKDEELTWNLSGRFLFSPPCKYLLSRLRMIFVSSAISHLTSLKVMELMKCKLVASPFQCFQWPNPSEKRLLQGRMSKNLIVQSILMTSRHAIIGVALTRKKVIVHVFRRTTFLL